MASDRGDRGDRGDRAYLAPVPFDRKGRSCTPSEDYLEWSKSAVSDGLAYLRLQPAYRFIQTGLDMINGDWRKSDVASLSDVTLELTIRNLKELTAAQTNIRIIPAFKTDIPEFDKQRDILNRCFMSWQQMTFADRAIRRCWQFATACGTGYIAPRWHKSFHYKTKGDIVLDAYGPLDVIPTGVPRSHKLQEAYSVTIKVETPLHIARRLYREFADEIRPSRENAKGRGTVMSQAVKYASAALRRFGPGATLESEPAPWETVDLYYSYIDDDAINDTGEDIPMGDPGTSWFYIVPYVGKQIPVGFTGTGLPMYRDAKPDDCLLYPNKRLIVCTPDLCVTPDPIRQVSPYWHGKFPPVQFRADDWPWTFLGFPLTRAGQSIEKANIELMRGVIDSCNARLSPPRAYDRNTMSNALAQTLNTRIPNQVVGLDMTFSGGDQLKPLLPVQFYEFPAYIPAIIQANEGRLTHQMGVADATALSRARQLPAGDSIDKIMEALGPLVRDQSRNMEEGIRGIGEMWKSNFFQFITAKRRMELIGADGVTQEDFDLDPGTLIPATIPMEQTGTSDGVPYFERARWHKDQFSFTVVPYSLHELNSITRKLFHLQLMRSGFPVDWWTLADLFDVKNFGPPPKFTDPETGERKTANTVMERWAVQMEIMQRIGAAGAAAGAKGKGGGSGRPPTGQSPPTLEQKRGEGGTRSTIRESGR